MTIYFTNTN